MTDRKNSPLEDSIRDCYRTWSNRYYDEYYKSGGAYPPVHVDLIRRELESRGVRALLDAGCGPASMLRDLRWPGLERWGFDLTPEMVAEAKRVLGEQGVPPARLWQGSALNADDYRRAIDAPKPGYDAAICFGVLPHIPAAGDGAVLRNLIACVRPGGLVAVEARNALFALFTQNRYTAEFFRRDLIRADELKTRAGDRRHEIDSALDALEKHFRMDLPPKRKGYEDEAGYDEVLSRTHNPFELRAEAEAAGLVRIRTLFYHFHVLPPMFEGGLRDLFRAESVAMENPGDWRGHFMASAFVLVGEKSA